MSVVSLLFKTGNIPKSITLKEKWDLLVKKLTNQFADGDELNIDGIINLISVQELGNSHQEFKKDEGVDLTKDAIVGHALLLLHPCSCQRRPRPAGPHAIARARHACLVPDYD